jgi:diacylglycerol kinase (ATP)
MKPGKTGISRIIAAANYSRQGLVYAFRNEAAFRQELVLALILSVAAFFLAESVVELFILILPIVLVLIVELFNSAIEAVVDRIGDEPHELSGAAKDIGSAAVLVSIVFLILVWTAFLLSKF